MASECVKVMVRCRPMNQLEIGKKSVTCVEVDQQSCSITLTNVKEKGNNK